MRTIYEPSDIDLEHLTPEQKLLDSLVMLAGLEMMISRDPDGQFNVEKFRRGLIALGLNAITEGGWKLERITEPIPEGFPAPEVRV